MSPSTPPFSRNPSMFFSCMVPHDSMPHAHANASESCHMDGTVSVWNWMKMMTCMACMLCSLHASWNSV